MYRLQVVFASPRPNRFAIYADYLQGGEAALAAVNRKLNRPNVRAIHERAVDHALSFALDGAVSLFDMGCGAGSIMEAAKRKGLNAAGNDINKSAVDRLNQMGFDGFHGADSKVKCNSYQSSKVRPCTTPHPSAISSFSPKNA